MYKRVVVPLDGSKLAEMVLPHLEEIAKGCSIPEILLVSVTESVSGKISGMQASEYTNSVEYRKSPLATGTSHSGLVLTPDTVNMKDVPVALGKMAKSALTYLATIVHQLEKKGLTAKAHVAVGSPAEEIISFADDKKADLIIMATHGRGGLSRFAFGSVAEKVVRATEVPVMLVKPGRGFKETKPRRKGKAS